MQPLEIDPTSLAVVFDVGQGGVFKPYGLFKFVISATAPTLDTSSGVPALPEGVTMSPTGGFYTFNAVNKRLYVFNLSQHSKLLVERGLT